MWEFLRRERERRERLRRLREEEDRFIEEFDAIEEAHKERMIEFEKMNKRVIAETNALKLREEHLMQMEKEYNDKINVLTKAGDPAQMMVLAIDKVWDQVVEMHKGVMVKTVATVRHQIETEERKKYDHVFQQALKSFSYTDGVATPKTILKIKRIMEDEILVKEREGKKEEVADLTVQLDVLKKLEIVK